MVRSVFIVGFCIIYFINGFVQTETLHSFLSFIAFFVLILCLSFVEKSPKIMGFTLTFVGVFLNFYNDVPLMISFEGLQNNFPILVLILVVPLFALPFKISGYLNSAYYLLGQLGKSPGKVYKW
jgi:hypothetical protein